MPFRGTRAKDCSSFLSLASFHATRSFGGTLTKYSFTSSALGGLDANLNVFVPPNASSSSKAPVLFYLSGLTCTEDNACVLPPSALPPRPSRPPIQCLPAARLARARHTRRADRVAPRPRSAQKGNFLGPAAKEGIAILFPDTSPRGAGVEGETDSWDFGVGACSVYPPPHPLCPVSAPLRLRAAGLVRRR